MLLVGLQALQFYINWPIWQDIWAIGYRDEEASQVLLAPIVFLYLMFQQTQRFANWKVHGRWIAIPVFLLAWALHLAGETYGWESMWHASAIFSLFACTVAALGIEIFKRFWACWVVTLFMIPVPGILRRAIASPMQLWTASAAEWISISLGLGVERAGHLLYLNGRAITIDEACSGLRMVFAIGLVSWALAFGSRLKGWQRLLIVLLAPALAMFANILRVVPTLWGYGFLSENIADQLHDWGGWIMLAMAFVIPKAIITLIEQPDDPAPPQQPQPGWFSRQTWLDPVALVILVMLMLGAGFYQPRFKMPEYRESYFKAIQAVSSEVPYRVGPWRGRDEQPQEAAERMLHPNVIMQRRYVNQLNGVQMSLLFVHCEDVRDMEGHYPPACYPKQGWQQTDVQQHEVQTAMLDFDIFTYQFAPTHGQNTDLTVYNFFILPTGRILGDYQPVRSAAGDPNLRFGGGAQVQFVFDNRSTLAQQMQAVELFTATLTDLLQLVADGPGGMHLKMAPQSAVAIEE